MSLFDELKTSLEEAVEIKQGKQEPSRVTEYEITNVKALRTKLNESQAEFAEAPGTSLDTIKSQNVNGKTSKNKTPQD